MKLIMLQCGKPDQVSVVTLRNQFIEMKIHVKTTLDAGELRLECTRIQLW